MRNLEKYWQEHGYDINQDPEIGTMVQWIGGVATNDPAVHATLPIASLGTPLTDEMMRLDVPVPVIEAQIEELPPL
jgi:hypothetical protein